MLHYKDYIKENLIDDVDAAKDIADLANRTIREEFDIDIDNPEMTLTIFSVIYREVVIKLMEKRDANYPMYKFIIANRVEIGYDESINDDYEKQGGFAPYIKHLYHEKPVADEKDYEDDCIQLCTAWNTINITTDIKLVRKIVEDSFKKLNEMDIKTGSSEVLMPIFASVYDALITYIKIKRAETKEYQYEINFVSLFDVAAKESDELDDVIVFTPAIADKLNIKSDKVGSSQFE